MDSLSRGAVSSSIRHLNALLVSSRLCEERRKGQVNFLVARVPRLVDFDQGTEVNVVGVAIVIKLVVFTMCLLRASRKCDNAP